MARLLPGLKFSAGELVNSDSVRDSVMRQTFQKSTYYRLSMHSPLKFQLWVQLQLFCTISWFFVRLYSTVTCHLIWLIYPFLCFIVFYNTYGFYYRLSISSNFPIWHQSVIMFWYSGQCENTPLIFPVKDFNSFIILQWDCFPLSLFLLLLLYLAAQKVGRTSVYSYFILWNL